jgi:hypothetical protein
MTYIELEALLNEKGFKAFAYKFPYFEYELMFAPEWIDELHQLRTRA